MRPLHTTLFVIVLCSIGALCRPAAARAEDRFAEKHDLHPSVSQTRHYAALQAGSLFSGEDRGEKGLRRVDLYLLDGTFFVLRQRTFSPRGKPTAARDMTGIWRQTKGGSLLRLSNRHGLFLRLNVGVHNLYGDFFPSPDGFAHSITLKEAAFSEVSFNLMGRLDRAEGATRLTDSATGRVFAPVEWMAEGAAALPKDDPLFVDVEILPTGTGCAVRRVRSFSTRLPAEIARESDAPDDEGASGDEDFQAAVKGVVWLLPPLPGLPLASCIFNGAGEKQGLLEVAGPGLRLEAGYTLTGRALAFTVRKKEAGRLDACGMGALPRVLASVRSWSLEGDALALTASDGQVLLLEKATLRGHNY